MTLIALLASMLAASAQPKTLTQQDLDRGVAPMPGDQVVLHDWSKLSPQSALSERSVRGQGWLRKYRENDKTGGTMLMTIERDMNKPETCIVPQVTYPLSLKGWYAVWVATYRGRYGGGVDVREQLGEQRVDARHAVFRHHDVRQDLVEHQASSTSGADQEALYPTPA